MTDSTMTNEILEQLRDQFKEEVLEFSQKLWEFMQKEEPNPAVAGESCRLVMEFLHEELAKSAIEALGLEEGADVEAAIEELAMKMVGETAEKSETVVDIALARAKKTLH